jgi:hypothetical protein
MIKLDGGSVDAFLTVTFFTLRVFGYKNGAGRCSDESIEFDPRPWWTWFCMDYTAWPDRHYDSLQIKYGRLWEFLFQH